MIELNISTDAVVNLIRERMNNELKMRKFAGMFKPDITLDDLNDKDFLAVVEASIIDLLFLLPAKLYSQENNLVEIIIKSFKILSNIYKRDFLFYYKTENAERLLAPITNALELSHREKLYISN